MRMSDIPLNERPREKLLALGPGVLSDAELLSIFIHTGTPGYSALCLSRRILAHFGGLRQLMQCDYNDLKEIRGFGDAKYALIQAAMELSKRYLQAKLTHHSALNNSHLLKALIQQELQDCDREVFACVFLDSKYRLISFEQLFYGDLTHTPVYPGVVVKRALRLNAHAVVLAHNHPSGDTDPSDGDIELTHDLTAALALVDIKVLDHIIVGNGEVASLADIGLIR